MLSTLLSNRHIYVSLISLLPLLGIGQYVQAVDTTLMYSVVDDNDDAEERGAGVPGSAGTMSQGSTDLELVYDGGTRQVVGIRFRDIAIVQGASTISNAYIQFTVDENDSGTTDVVIYGEDEDFTVEFGTANGDITGRSKTTSSVLWSGIATWSGGGTAGTDQQTPNISGIISEIVQRPGWTQLSSIVIIFEPDAACNSSACQRTAESFDGTAAPQLFITLDDSEVDTSIPSFPPPAAGTCYAVSDGTDELVLVPSSGFSAGIGTLIGSVGVPDIEAATFDSADNILYGADADQMGWINPNTGTFTALSSTFGTGDGDLGSVDFDDVDGLTYDITNDILYGTQATDDVIFEIDKTTGAHVPLAFNGGTDDYLEITGLSGAIDDVAISPLDGTVYVVTSTPGFYSVDLSTGVSTDLGAITGAADIEGMDFDDNGVLYGTTGAGQLYTIDVSTSVATAIGTGFGIGSDYEALSCVFGIGQFDPAVYFRMDESWTVPSAGVVLDYSGNGAHGDTVSSGGGTTVSNDDTTPALAGDPGTCGYGVFASNTNNNSHAIDSNFTPGNEGSITFWYNSNEDWTGVGTFDRLLFDASKNLGDESADRHFFLARRNNNNGSLRFVVEDSADTKLQAQVNNLSNLAGDWVHIGVTWDLPNSTLEIYVDGVLVATDTAPVTNGVMGDIQDLYFGDNRDIGLGGNGWTNDSTNGFLDEIRIYNNVISQPVVDTDFNSTHACNLVDHYKIEVISSSPGSCDPVEIKVTAHDVTDSAINVFNGTILNFSTLLGSSTRGSLLSGTGTWTPAGATATYDWPGGENSMNVEISNASTVTENIELEDGTARELSGTTEDPDIDFDANPIIRITTDGTDVGTITTEISGKDSDQAPSQTLYIQLKQSGVTVSGLDGCEVPGFYNGSHTVQVAAECIDSDTCAGEVVTVEDGTGTPTAVNTYDSGSVPASTASWTSVSMSFDGTDGVNIVSDNKASLVFNYPDAGQMILHFETTIDPAATPASQTPLLTFAGTSNNFVVRPFGFRVDDFSPSNPAATDENGSIFTKAGMDFTADITAVIWGSGDDTDFDGIPDSNAALTGNAATPNFGNESSAAIANLSHNLVAPVNASAQAGSLSGTIGTGFISGAIDNHIMSWDEVGIIQLDINESNNDYLGGGQDVTGQISNLGRFTPAFLTVQKIGTGKFDNSCPTGSFTYLDETFYFGPAANDAPRLRVRGVDTDGNVTFNYDSGSGAGGFWKLLSTTLDRSYTDTAGAAATLDPPVGVLLDTDVTFQNQGNYNGFVNLRLDRGTNGDPFLYQRVSEEAPFTASASLTFDGAGLVDDDGICYDGDGDTICEGSLNNDDDFSYGNIGTATMRFGRMNIGTAVGSELLPLSPAFVAEYHDGSSFITNTDDDCSSLVLTDHVRLENTGTLVAGDAVMTIGVGNTSISGFNSPLIIGDTQTVFAAPLESNTGFVNIIGNLDCSEATIACVGSSTFDHLLYDWDGDGGFDENPSGRVDFGVYEGASEFIYIREPW